MNMPTSDQVNSALRHVYTAAGTATAVLVMVGLSQGDATTIGNAVHQIGDGVASIIAGIGALIPIASALYAAWSASPFSKLISMKKNPEIAKVEAVPGTPTAALADAIPGNKITIATKAAAVLLAIGLASLAFAPSAMAQSNRINATPLLRKPAVTGNVIKDIKTDLSPSTTSAAGPSTGDPLANFMAQLEKTKAEDIIGVIADIQLADNDAATIITPAIAATPAIPANPNATPPTPAVPAFPGSPAVVKDPISHACYPAAIQFLSSIPAVAAPTGKFIGVQLFQAKRDFIAQLQAGLPTYLKLGCAPLLGDEVHIAIQVFNMIGIKLLPAAATAIMPALAPVTLPAMMLMP